MASRVAYTWVPKGTSIDKTDISAMNKDNFADYIIAFNSKDINYNLIMEMFGNFEGKCLAHSYDLIEIPANTFHFTDYDGKDKSNESKFTTTVGIYLINLFMTDIGISKIFGGYFSENINKKVYGKMEKKLSYALIENDITPDQLVQWEDTLQWFMPFEDILAPNHTEKMVTIGKEIDKKKAALLKQYKKEIDEGDIVTISKIEKELLDFAKEYLKDDPSIDTLESGAGGTWGNNFKNMYVMKGAVANPDPNAKQKYNIITSSYVNGVKAEEYPIIAGAGANGAYSRGKKTEDGGYIEKLFISAFQTYKLGPKGSDCGTKRTISVELTDSNIDDWMYSYIVDNSGHLTLLTSKNASKYVGKKVKFRFSSLCENPECCNKCAGDLLYVVAENIGVTMNKIPATLKLRCMKAFHDSTVNPHKMKSIRKVFYPYE